MGQIALRIQPIYALIRGKRRAPSLAFAAQPGGGTDTIRPKRWARVLPRGIGPRMSYKSSHGEEQRKINDSSANDKFEKRRIENEKATPIKVHNAEPFSFPRGVSTWDDLGERHQYWNSAECDYPRVATHPSPGPWRGSNPLQS